MEHLGWKKLINFLSNFYQDLLLHCLLKIVHLTRTQPKCWQQRRMLVPAETPNTHVRLVPHLICFLLHCHTFSFSPLFSPPLFIVVFVRRFFLEAICRNLQILQLVLSKKSDYSTAARYLHVLLSYLSWPIHKKGL